MIAVGVLLLLALASMFVGGLWYEIRLRNKQRRFR